MTSRDEITLTNEQIRDKYATLAKRYDISGGLGERLLGVERLRRQLLRRAIGRVLDVATGTGRNLPVLPAECEVTGIDLSPEMLEIARARAEKLGRHVTLLSMDAQELTFPDSTFDTVVSSLSTCTFPDPVRALREMARVCKPDGRILLLEHGRSSAGIIGRLQDRFAPYQVRALACHWNREPLELVQAAGLEALSSRRTVFGVFHAIEAKPSKTK